MVAYYYTRDHLGSVREMLNSSGAIVARYSYDPYGKTTLVSGSNGATKQYAGTYMHQPSGLNLTKHRAYKTNFGRWISRDPIGEEGDTNLFNYCGGNPISFKDPLGLCSCGIIKGPEYDQSGKIPGGTWFTWSAKFMDDAEHKPYCCEVHQEIMWKNEHSKPVHKGKGAFPDDARPNVYQEDRTSDDARYGHRTGPYASSGFDDPYDYYNDKDNSYHGADDPQGGWGKIWTFHLIVRDVCNGDKIIYTSKSLEVDN